MGYSMAQAVILWPFEAEAQVHSHASPLAFVVDDMALRLVYLRVLGGCLVSIIARIHLYINDAL